MTKMMKKLFILPLFTLLIVGVMAVAAKSSVLADSSLLSNGLDVSKVEKVDVETLLDTMFTESFIDLGLPSAEDEVWVIVELETPSMLEYAETAKFEGSLNQYLQTANAAKEMSKIQAEQATVKAEIEKVVDAEFKYAYSTITNGLAVKVKYGDCAKLWDVPGVKEVVYSFEYLLPEDNSVTDYVTDIATLQGAKSNSEYRGQGMVIGILDTGLQTSHEAFSVNPTVVGLGKADIDAVLDDTIAQLFSSLYTGELMSAEDVYVSDKVPYAYDYADVDNDVNPDLATMEEVGNEHGTHVAGIAAGNNGKGFEGAAPDAQLAIFKVFSDSSSGAATIDIVAALNDAVVLGVDVVNMSLGSPCGFSVESQGAMYQEYYDAVYESGINLVCSAGNQYMAGLGTNYTYGTPSWLDQGTISSPSSYNSSFSVASYDTENVKEAAIILGGVPAIFNNAVIDQNTSEQIDFIYELVGDSTENKEFEFAYAGLGSAAECRNANLSGKIALIKRGELSFSEKTLNAQACGAVAVVIFNNVPGSRFNPVVEGCDIPVCAISLEDGSKILASGRTDAQVGRNTFIYGGTLSEFSSWGPLSNLELKPEITTYGGSVYSALPNASSDGYALMSGTSMASPNMAGNVAIVKQYLQSRFYNDELQLEKVSDMAYQLLMSTAIPQVNRDNNELYGPRRQGAGLVNVDGALSTPAYLYVRGQQKTKIELGDDPDRSGVYSFTFTVANMSAEAVAYEIDTDVLTTSLASDGVTIEGVNLAIEDAKNTYGVSGKGSLNGNVVTVDARSEVIVSVKIALSDETKASLDALYDYGTYVEGYVRLYALGDNEIDLAIPYLAFYGDWDEAPILDANEYEGDAIGYESTLISYYYGGKYILKMGTYKYDVPTGYIEPKISQDHNAIAPLNQYAAFGIYSVYMGLLRNASYLTYEIYDADTGELLDSLYGDYIRKAYYNFTAGGYYPVVHQLDIIPEYANNSHLQFVVTAHTDTENPYENARYQYVYELYIDNESPHIIGMDQTAEDVANGVEPEEPFRYVEEDGRSYLEFDVYDNHALQSYVLYTSRQQSLTGHIPFYTEIGETTTVRHDITDFIPYLTDNKVMVYVDDYAMNYTAYIVTLPIHAVESASFDQEEYVIEKGSYVFPDILLEPYNGYVDTSTITFTSSKPSVAYAHPELAIIGLNIGEATVTLSFETKDGVEISCSAKVKVVEPTPVEPEPEEPVEEPDVSSVDIALENSLITVHDVLQLTAQVVAKEGVEVVVEWSSSDENVATVDQTGKVTAVASGEAVITASVGELSDSCVLVVKENVKDLIIVAGNLIGYTGQGGEVVIPEGVVAIAEGVFANSDITAVTIPESVELIGDSAFANCTSLAKVTLNSVAPIEWNNGSELYGEGKVFAGCSNVEIIAPQGGYYNSSKDGIIYSYDYQVIEYVFDGFASDYVMADSVVMAVPFAFAWQSFDSFTFGKNFAYVDEFVFAGTSAPSLVIPATIAEIATDGFALSMFDEVVFEANPNLVINENAFEYSYVSKVTLPEGMVAVPTGMFEGSENLSEVVWPSTLQEIEPYAFYGTGFEGELELPNSVTVLGYGAFGECYYITKVVLPANLQTIYGFSYYVTSVPEQPFYLCYSLETYEIAASNQFFKTVDGVLYSKDGKSLYSYPTGKQDLSYTILPGTAKIKSGAFEGNYWLEEVVIAESVAAIGDFAFYGCEYLSTVVFLGSHAPALEQELAAGSDGVMDVNLYANFVQEILDLNTLEYVPVRGLTMVIAEDSKGYDGWAYKMFFEETIEVSMEEVLAASDLALESLGDGIKLDWNGSQFGVCYYVFRALYDDNYELVAVTYSSEYVDSTALAVASEYKYVVLPVYEGATEVHVGDELEASITREASAEEEYLLDLIEEIKQVLAVKNSSVTNLLKSVYAEYAALSAKEQAVVGLGAQLLDTYADYQEALAFVNKVLQTKKSEIYAESRSAIEQLNAEYAALSEEVRAYTTVASRLESWTNDIEAVAKLIKKVQLFPTVDEFSGSAIAELKASYQALTPYQKTLVDPIYAEGLAKIEGDYVVALKQAEMKKNVEAVVKLINEIPENPTNLDVPAIEKARAAYDALTDDEKAMFPASSLELLAQLESATPAVGCTISLGSVIVSTLSAFSLLAIVFKKRQF